MKQLKSILILILSAVFGLGFTSCDNNGNTPDGFPTAEELVNTRWTGQDESRILYEISIVSESELQLTISDSEGNVYADHEPLTYAYNPDDGTFRSAYMGQPVAGKITGTVLTFEIDGETVSLRKA